MLADPATESGFPTWMLVLLPFAGTLVGGLITALTAYLTTSRNIKSSDKLEDKKHDNVWRLEQDRQQRADTVQWDKDVVRLVSQMQGKIMGLKETGWVAQRGVWKPGADTSKQEMQIETGLYDLQVLASELYMIAPALEESVRRLLGVSKDFLKGIWDEIVDEDGREYGVFEGFGTWTEVEGASAALIDAVRVAIEQRPCRIDPLEQVQGRGP